MNAADIAIQYAMAQIGKPYCWGGIGPSCFDCSGLVQMAYLAGNVQLPRTTYQQVLQGTSVAQTDLAPGDLVFPDPGHVQIFVGGNQIIEAPRTGLSVRTVPMWGFWQARRVTTPGGGVGLSTAQPGVPVSTSANQGCVNQLVGTGTAVLLLVFLYRKRHDENLLRCLHTTKRGTKHRRGSILHRR